MDLAENIARVRRVIDEKAPGRAKDITMVAVTKTRPPEEINLLLGCGVADIGENRVQEWLSKKEDIASGFRLHHIGQLQTNKVKYLIGHVHMIQSVDRLSLLSEISRLSPGGVNILIQVNTAREAQKAGVLEEDLPLLFERAVTAKGVKLRGFMCIAPLDGGRDAARAPFEKAKLLFDEYAQKMPVPGFDTLSMGMSGDYDIALECGANMIRVGSTLFI